jgi:hypothetical protein
LQIQITYFIFAPDPALLLTTEFLITAPSIYSQKTSRMKKLNTYLHNPDVQAVIFISCIFAAIALVTVFTWGK